MHHRIKLKLLLNEHNFQQQTQLIQTNYYLCNEVGNLTDCDHLKKG